MVYLIYYILVYESFVDGSPSLLVYIHYIIDGVLCRCIVSNNTSTVRKVILGSCIDEGGAEEGYRGKKKCSPQKKKTKKNLARHMEYYGRVCWFPLVHFYRVSGYIYLTYIYIHRYAYNNYCNVWDGYHRVNTYYNILPRSKIPFYTFARAADEKLDLSATTTARRRKVGCFFTFFF